MKHEWVGDLRGDQYVYLCPKCQDFAYFDYKLLAMTNPNELQRQMAELMARDDCTGTTEKTKNDTTE